MQAKAILVINAKEVDNATETKERLGYGVEIPNEEYGNYDLLFNIKDVNFCYITPRHNIMMLVNNDYFEIEYNDDVWDKLKEHFECM